MAQTPEMPERDDPTLEWLTQDRRVRLDWSSLDDDQYEAEVAAALFSLASLEKTEAMPDTLAAKVLAAAHPPAVTTPVASTRASSWWESLRLAWGMASFAGAAALVMAVRLSTLPAGMDQPAVQLELAQAQHFSISPGPDAAGQAVRGEVVWDAGKGGGYLKLAGLPVNDPSREQYQLWIFDGTRDERFPVDGGVFNVERNGEIEVWIRVPIPVRDAALFAVTVEQAGGTVVSDRGRIVALAKTKT